MEVLLNFGEDGLYGTGINLLEPADEELLDEFVLLSYFLALPEDGLLQVGDLLVLELQLSLVPFLQHVHLVLQAVLI